MTNRTWCIQLEKFLNEKKEAFNDSYEKLFMIYYIAHRSQKV